MDEGTDATFQELVEAGVLSIGDGYRAKLNELGQGGPPFLRAGALQDTGFDWTGLESFTRDAQIESKRGRSADTVITTKGNSIGRVGWVPADAPDFVYSPHLSFWRSIDPGRIAPRFLYYWARDVAFLGQLRNLAFGTDMAPYLSLRDQLTLRITLPNISTQRAIAEVLGALDDKIAANHKAASASVDLIHCLYRSAIEVDGATTQSLFDVLEVDFGEAFKGEHFVEPGTGRPLVRIRDLRTFRPQTWTRESRPREVIIRPADVLVGMDAEFRATWWLGNEGLLNQRVCRVRGREVGPAFVAEALRQPLAAIESGKSGTTVIHLNKSDLARSQVALPEPNALRAFEDRAEAVLQGRVQLAHENQALATTRDELLPLLMSGKTRVKDAEKRVEGEI